MNTADFIKENCSTLGFGDLVLSGPVDASVGRFNDAWQVSTSVYYSILDGVNRESGQGTYDGVDTITRDNVYSTIENGLYNDVNPTPIELNGLAVVACTLNADVFNGMVSSLSAIQTNTDNIAINSDAISDLDILISSNASNIAINSVDIDTNKAAIATTDGNVALLDSDVNFRETAITAMEAGGEVVSNGPTTVTISAGYGEIINSYDDIETQDTKQVTWDEVVNFELIAAGGMPALTGIGYTEIGVSKPTDGDGVGTPVAIPNGASNSQRRTTIILAAVEYLDRVITQVTFKPIVSNQVGNVLMDWISYTDLADRLKGMLLRPTTVGDLSCWRDAGEVFSVGLNYQNSKSDPNVTQIIRQGDTDTGITFTPVTYTDGQTGTGIPTTTFDSANFEEDPNSATGIGPITNAKAVIHYLLQSLNNEFYMSYGQLEYDDYEIAKASLFADNANHIFPAETSNMILLAQIVVLKDAAAWGLTAEIFPLGSAVSSSSAGGSATSALNITYTDVYNLGTNVQVAIDSLASIKLSPDQYEAINGAVAPSAGNPYSTKSYTDGDNVIATAGYQDFPGGLIMQWGYGSVSITEREEFFEKAFPTACINVQCQLTEASGNERQNIYIRGVTTTSFLVEGEVGYIAQYRYTAIGY